MEIYINMKNSREKEKNGAKRQNKGTQRDEIAGETEVREVCRNHPSRFEPFPALRAPMRLASILVMIYDNS